MKKRFQILGLFAIWFAVELVKEHTTERLARRLAREIDRAWFSDLGEASWVPVEGRDG